MTPPMSKPKRQKDMKKGIIALFALLFAAGVQAQEPSKFKFTPVDTARVEKGFTPPDSLAHMSPWKPDYRKMEPMRVKPSVSMTSVVVIPESSLPARVTVIDNNTLRLGSHFNLSNGQAWNGSPFPDAYLDARTLSFPMPR